MEMRFELDRLRALMIAAYEHYGSLTHRRVVWISQLLDRKLNEYERLTAAER